MKIIFIIGTCTTQYHIRDKHGIDITTGYVHSAPALVKYFYNKHTKLKPLKRVLIVDTQTPLLSEVM